MNGESKPPSNGWRIARDISLPGIFALAIQTGAFIWWLATLSSTVGGLVAANAALVSANNKLQAEVSSLSAAVTVPIALLAQRVETLNSRAFAVEDQLRGLNNDLATMKLKQVEQTRR